MINIEMGNTLPQMFFAKKWDNGCDDGVDDLNFVSGGRMIICLETL